MSGRIKKVGQLRQYLGDLMHKVMDGTAKVEETRVVVKLAEKINDSFYSETKVQLLAVQLGKKAVPTGELSLDSEQSLDAEGAV